VKVLDFGVAKLTAEDGLAARTQALTGTGSMVGTPYYMSPEQVFADKDLDARADVWSLGIVMYECLSGVRPTEADTVGRVLKRIMEASFEPLAAHDAGLPDDAVALVTSALAVDRSARPGLAAIRGVLARHARSGAPSFSRAPVVETIDPHAATVITPHDEPRAHAAHAPNDAEALAGIDTNRAVSVMPPMRGRARTRFVGYGALAVVLLLAGLVVLRGRRSAEEKPLVDPTSAVSIALNEPPPRPSASAPPRASAAEERAPTPPSSATSLATAPAAIPAPPLRPSPVSAGVGPAATVLSRPACEAGEVSSEGHCCPRGHEWRGGRCERPLATSF
jgi:hypothetical protein